MSENPAHMDVTVGITNTRLSAVKRGIAVQLATQLSVAAQTEVCLIGADPTDHDVQRRMPELLASGQYRRMEVKHGPHTVEVVRLLNTNLTVVLLSDRAVVEPVLTRVREIFRFVIVDAPSRVGGGVGIARVLPPFLNALAIASGVRAEELTLTRSYIDALESAPFTRHLDRRVVLAGRLADSGLAPHQLERKLARLPVFERQRARALATDPRASPQYQRDGIGCLVEWIVGLRNARVAASSIEHKEHYEQARSAARQRAASGAYRQISRS
jgi:hypothetical protein